METHLKIEHLAPYLPYGLKVFSNKIETLIGIESAKVRVREFDLYFPIENCKPILRPLSDLTKEIEHEGEKFVPLIELYKWSNEYNYNKELDYEFIDSWGAKGNILKVFLNREKDEYTEFVYGNGSFRKDTRHNEGSYVFGMTLPHAIRCDNKIHNEYKLYQLLFEWHFDIFGLIEKGLAIDINTLNEGV